MEDQIIQTVNQQQEKPLTVNPKVWNDKSEKLLTPDFLMLLTNLHLCLNEERKAILDFRNQINKALQKEFKQVITDQQITVDDFDCAAIPETLKNFRTQIICPANQTHELIKLINGNERYLKPDAVVIDFSNTLKPSWNAIVDGVNNVIEIANANARFTQRSFAEFSLTGEKHVTTQPQLIIKPRPLQCEESNITINDENYPAAMLDVALIVFYAAPLFIAKNKIPVFNITCTNQYEAQWWNELFTVLEEVLNLNDGQLKTIVAIDSTPGSVVAEAIVFELRNRIVGLEADFKGKVFNDLKLLRKKADNIVAERKALHFTDASLQVLSKQVCALALKYNLLSVAGLSINAAGKFVDFKDVEIAHYEEELSLINAVGFNMLTVSHQGYIEYLRDNLKAFPADASIPQHCDVLPTHAPIISMLGLRDNIRTAITYLHAWNQGIGYAVFDNRWEDHQTFEIIRAQVYQWIRNSVHIATTGERINSRMITTIILEETDKLQNEIKEEFAGNPISEIQTIQNTYTQAALEVEALFLNDELQEYFGNVS